MASIWDSLKNAGNAWQQTQKTMYTAPTTTPAVTKPKTSPATVGNGAGANGSYAISGLQDATNKLTAELGDVAPNIVAGAGSGGGGTGGGGTAGSVYDVYARAVDEQNRLLKEQRDLAEKQRRASMEATITANNMAADKSLKEAYIANMLAKKNLPQQLKALGISGGASETTLADIENTYMNNRFGIEDGRNEANLKARLAYDDGVAGDYAQYLTKAFDLQGTIADRLAGLGTAKASGGTTSAPATTAAGYKVGNITAKDEVDLYQQLMNAGYNQEAVEQYLLNQGVIKPSAGRSER